MDSSDEFDMIRPTLFLNLAAANLKLGGAEECIRCCNSVIQLCNSPGLLYSNMTSAEEVASVMNPSAEAMEPLIAKALFRRGKCFEALGDCSRAIEDYQAARVISPTDKEIQTSLTTIEDKVFQAVKPERKGTAAAYPVTISPSSSLIEDQMTNGGRCWMRRGLWSQSVSECTVHLPIAHILQDLYPHDIHHLSDCSPTSTRPNTSTIHSSLKKWRANFRSKLVTIHAYQSEGTCALKLELELSHNVISSECTWTLDLTSTTDSRVQTSYENENEGDSGDRIKGPNCTDPGPNSCIEGYLVLHLSKSPCSGSDAAWFPGQEVGNVYRFAGYF
jgi:tetratricopeptide (TPR) repeat protein